MYCLQLIEKLYRARWTKLDGLGALVLTPTRELALQIFEELVKVGFSGNRVGFRGNMVRFRGNGSKGLVFQIELFVMVSHLFAGCLELQL